MTRRAPRARPSGREVLLAQESEQDWQKWVTDLADWTGWTWTHFLAVRLPSGAWGVPLEGRRGLPDLVLARAGVVVFAELKRQDGQLRPDQAHWAGELGGSFELWRPGDRDRVRAVLTAPRGVVVPRVAA